VNALLLVVAVAAAAASIAWWRERTLGQGARRDALGLRRQLDSAASELQNVRGRLTEQTQKHDEQIEDLRARLTEQTRQRESEVQALLERFESQIGELESTLSGERELRTRVEAARESERKWRQALRSQFNEAFKDRSYLAAVDDVPSLVLHTALVLLEAEKGMLLSRVDEDRDGRLDVVAAEGFKGDPKESGVAQHFAGRVLTRDEMVRESDPGSIQAESENPVDAEIENLVAIPIYIQDEFSGVVICANKAGGFDESDDDVLLALGDHAGAVLDNARLHGDLRNAYVTTVAMLAEAVEAKDPFLRRHSDQASTYVGAVADRLGVEPDKREGLIFAALLHDVGKIGISERLLLKPAPLTPEERSVVQLHPRIGYRFVQQIPALRSVALGILHHHERYDGEGYPFRLKGEKIPLEGRLIAVSDAFSAMIAGRPYKEAMSVEEASAELERSAGTQFDPKVVAAFVEEVRRRPPEEDRGDGLPSAMADIELGLRRDPDEPILGHASLAVTDNLTLFYTHRYFHEVAEAEAHRADLQGTGFAVVLCEVSNISEINRTKGYAAGDATLLALAEALQRLTFDREATLSRFGGRTLALLLPHASEEEAETVGLEVSAVLVPGARVTVACASWRPGDDGEAVIDRARGRLIGKRALPFPEPK
jgi:diguanylate cyclase (GGDEF)-like protein